MFKLYDAFTAIDNNKQPYSVSFERHTETANLHAGVTERGFALKSLGNRIILNSPKFQTGLFSMDFSISFPYEINPCFQLIFDYDKVSRTGLALQFIYDAEKGVSAELVSVKNSSYTPVSGKCEASCTISENSYTTLVLKIEKDGVVCRIGEAEFAFPCKPSRSLFAIDRSAFIGELIINKLSLESNEEFCREQLIHTEALKLPLINGGDIPYTVCFDVCRLDGEYYLSAALDGGTKSRPLNKKERAGQYVAEIDWMDTPYVGIRSAGSETIFNLAYGEKCFVDPNIFWDCQKIFFSDTPLPLLGFYRLDGFDPNCEAEFIFGYKKLFCKGYAQQVGGTEFRFSQNGDIIYSGTSTDGSDCFELLSPPDKKAISLIDREVAYYDDIVEHLKKNHYFSVDEDICFTLAYRTKICPDYLHFKAEIKNVFETKVLAQTDASTSLSPYINGYGELCASVRFAPLPLGVYKIVFTVFYGDDEYKSISRAFEVYDEQSSLCPPIAAGLPFMFTMNNEQKKLLRNGFDLTNPMPSCDFGHYIACATTTPVEAEMQEIWKNIKLFGRKWFAWLAIRTCDDYLSEVHNATIENADYLFHTGINTDNDPLGPYSLYPNRIDHFWRHFYTYPGVKSLIDEFFGQNPELSQKTGYDKDDSMSEEVYKNIISVCGDMLIEYLNERKHKLVAEHNRELEKINPRVKRSIYGPLPPYNNPTLTHHSLKYFGLPTGDCLSDEYYSGFAIFEDYPFSCSYQTYRGAFTAMTVLLHSPRLTLYPELYTGSRGGCIDGAVKYAHAPMGDYECPPYQNSTLAFEYVYNTAYRTKDGFSYWKSYGFHRGLDTCDYINEFVRNWRYVAEYKPSSPLRSIGYIADYSGDKDMYNFECSYYNQSEMGQTIVYECARESGVPNGFGLLPEVCGEISEKDCDVLVVPSLKNADSEYLSQLRRLYNAGVSLIALSDVTGLEDIFGVEPCAKTENISYVEYNGKKEYVYNTTAEFKYKPTFARTEVSANGNPVCLTTDRTLLINTALYSLGCADKNKGCYAKGAFIVGSLIRRAITDNIIRLSSPAVFGENVGTTVFETENGDRMLLAINYTPFDNREHPVKEAIVRINMPDVVDVSSDIAVKKAKSDGIVKEIRFDILPHGFAFIKLIHNGES